MRMARARRETQMKPPVCARVRGRDADEDDRSVWRGYLKVSPALESASCVSALTEAERATGMKTVSRRVPWALLMRPGVHPTDRSSQLQTKNSSWLKRQKQERVENAMSHLRCIRSRIRRPPTRPNHIDEPKPLKAMVNAWRSFSFLGVSQPAKPNGDRIRVQNVKNRDVLANRHQALSLIPSEAKRPDWWPWFSGSIVSRRFHEQTSKKQRSL